MKRRGKGVSSSWGGGSGASTAAVIAGEGSRDQNGERNPGCHCGKLSRSKC